MYLYFLALLPNCLKSCFVQKIFAIKSLSRRKPEQMYSEGTIWLSYGRLLARFTVHRLAKFDWVLFANLRLRSLAMKYNAEFAEFM